MIGVTRATPTEGEFTEHDVRTADGTSIGKFVYAIKKADPLALEKIRKAQAVAAPKAAAVPPAAAAAPPAAAAAAASSSGKGPILRIDKVSCEYSLAALMTVCGASFFVLYSKLS